MNYIVLDLEWNMPANSHRRVRSPITLNGEIIQIGAVKLDEGLEEIGEFNVKVRPVFYRKMNKRIEELTSITGAELEHGESFEDVVGRFREWCGNDSIMHDIPYDWIPEHFDAQFMFDLQETMEDRDFSLDYAFYYFGLKGSKAHDALNDARDTAAVIRKLDLEDFIREEREYRKELADEKPPGE